MIKLDYSIESPQKRKELVEKILEHEPNPTPAYLEILADYLIFCMEKQEKRERKILTDNRLATVNKRETSLEGLISQFENGEDGVYGIVNNNKHVIFQPKISITKKDLERFPELQQARDAIAFWDAEVKKRSGKEAYIAKRALIESRKDQYVIKEAMRKPVHPGQLIHSDNYIRLDGKEYIDEKGNCASTGVSLTNPKACSAILCNYSKLKQDSYGIFHTGVFSLMLDFDRICGRALKDYPLYEKIVMYKIDGLPNTAIQEKLEEEFGIKHSLEYISSLWRKKIPNLIASTAEDEFYYSYYLEEEKGNYKRCSRCGKIKLAHNKYFSKNKTSKDHFYSICKECRNAKTKEDKDKKK